jgi:hypothetical protein
MLSPLTQTEFDALAKQGYNRIPLVAETFADLDTPLSLYLKLANKPYSYLWALFFYRLTCHHTHQCERQNHHAQ